MCACVSQIKQYIRRCILYKCKNVLSGFPATCLGISTVVVKINLPWRSNFTAEVNGKVVATPAPAEQLHGNFLRKLQFTFADSPCCVHHYCSAQQPAAQFPRWILVYFYMYLVFGYIPTLCSLLNMYICTSPVDDICLQEPPSRSCG